MKLWQFHGGVHLNGYKELSCDVPIAPAHIPQYLILPLQQHIGEPTKPVVKVGDKVLKGQIIAECRMQDCSMLMSAPIHASSSGTVVSIETHHVPHPSGLKASCIIIETDGEDRWIDLQPITNYETLSSEVVRGYVAKAGIVGLGGAGFPSHIKLRPGDIEILIINGAECEPYITCDDRLMREYPQDIIAGAQILRHILGDIKQCFIGVEDNKPQAYDALLQAARGQNIEVIKVPTLYPTGGERQLIKVLTNKEIGRGQLPADKGIIVHNIETTRAVYRAVTQGKPLISRVVTITGDGIKTPSNLEVLLGTPMNALIEQCGKTSSATKLIMGGTMMGLSLPTDEMPVVKTTNCLLSLTNQEASQSNPVMPCIRCGACASACPINLLPQQLYWYVKAKDFEKVQDYALFDCIECGCCSYVCPSHIPLISYYRYAKAEIRAQQTEKQKSDIARQRHEFKKFRLEREKAEKAARHREKIATPSEGKKSVIKEAMEKMKAKAKNK